MMTESPFRRLLFAVDDTGASRLAVPLVAGYARAWRADLHVLHVQAEGEAPAAAEALVTAVVDAAGRLGVAASGRVYVLRDGMLEAAVAGVARQREADLVVIGSHEQSALAAILTRTTGHRVASKLSVPVLVARISPGLRARPVRIVVAIDASSAADLAVNDAIRAARPTDAAVRVVHVLEAGEGRPTRTIESEQDVEQLVDRAVIAIQGSGVEADGEVVLPGGCVVEAIAAAARHFDADLVVVASRRPSDLQGFLLGSVAYDLNQVLDRPVLMAHRA